MRHSVTLYPYETGKKRKCVVDGVTYDTISDMRCVLRLSESKIRLCELENNLSKEDAIAFLLEQRDILSENRVEKIVPEKKTTDFIFRGRVFKSYPSCVEYYNNKYDKYMLNDGSIRSIAKRRGVSLQEVLEEQIQGKLRKFVRRNLASEQKAQYMSVNTDKKAIRIAKNLGSRCTDLFLDKYASKENRWIIEYKVKE